MRFPVICVPSLPAQGMALFPFILVKRPQLKTDQVIINHETIHLMQQAEMLVLPFYVFYLLNYLFNRMKGQKHFQAYRNIAFEKEAYAMDRQLNYLTRRKLWAWTSF
ncbi:hypothetical protein [Hufsiella ginkgonis]|uniref:DUF4157 domain-containing protein n=1 Tax=Hufsiella ginkgonis TaxID=2695274 RepID=A0A7K1XVI7_9SPHI|nr:hypothetical protein [Hufsiella ginkgonis]MXV14779.1 hypothetical protein [Hufsiella ginkgonis]